MSTLGILETTKYFVLLALAEGSAHGYAIEKTAVGDSVGAVYLRPSTLYATLKSLEKAGLIEGLEETGSGAPRKTYKLTPAGTRKLADTARVHDRAASLAKARLGLRY